MAIKNILIICLLTVCGLVLAYLRRKFSSETLANGHMDLEKGKEIAPTIFDQETKKKP